ncbi:MAG: TonB-dependent receptor [Zetaproteobacteria bacterium]|nr:MAG: TonB-dependent receptor [Zetaproteobacteria bacterium]
MTPRLKATAILATIITTTPVYSVLAEEQASSSDHARTVMERVMVIGNAEAVQDITGSAQFIGKETLDQNNYTDINRVLRQIPGVNIQEEEGYGNRPNIGLRGGRSERSADITLMEDGILIAPAPYAASSAYYFPRVSRMEAVEVRKGSSTIKFGPRTTSGAINLISSSVPQTEEIEALTAYGTDNTQRLQGHYGNSVVFGSGTFGYVFDVSHEATDGFKSIDIVGGDTGYSIQDLMGKVKFSTDVTADVFQSVEIKFGATTEESDETYIGLTQEDFNADPYRRYAASQVDNMDANHRQYHIRHFIDFGNFDATTTFYHNQFSRNWYKLDDVTVGGVRSSLSGSLSSAPHLSALKGLTDLDGGAANNLTVRANNRDYYSTGIQSDLATQFGWGETEHQVEFGARYHYDKEDRFQHEDLYAITNGVMTLASAGDPGSNANRHGTAKATALYVLDEINYGKWTFVPGVRYEYIELKREDFSSGQVRKNTVDAFVPGLGVGYAFTDEYSVFGGIHKGFAPPSPSSTNDDNEESINFELGGRYNGNVFNVELVGFFNDYSNLLGECTLSSGCTGGATGDQFNAGEVDAYGLEFSLSYDAAPALKIAGLSLPIDFNYTYTKAEFQNNFVSGFNEWGNVSAGDELPYIPEHQFYISAGVVAAEWEVYVAGKYVDEMRTQAGSGAIPFDEGTDAHFIVDVAGEYEIHEGIRFFATADNIFDTEYVSARRPAGARPGKPFTALAGVKFEF